MKLPEHSRQHDHYRVDCGVPSPNNGTVDYALTTKCGQGDIFYENGDHDFVAKKTSKEVVGKDITNEQTPAKIIRAEIFDLLLLMGKMVEKSVSRHLKLFIWMPPQ